MRDKMERDGLFRSERAQNIAAQPPGCTHVTQALDTACTQLTLNLTERCNLNCAYCVCGNENYYRVRPHGTRDMSWETARRAIDFYLERCDEAYPRSVTFYGGEPLLCFDMLKRCVEYAHDRAKARGIDDLVLGFTTNLTLLTDEMLDFIAAYKIGVVVSLDGPKEIHDHNRVFRGGGGTWDRVMENFNRMVARRSTLERPFHISIVSTISAEFPLEGVLDFFSQSEFGPFSTRIGFVNASYLTKTPMPRRDRREEMERLEQEFLGHIRDGVFSLERLTGERLWDNPRWRRAKLLRILFEEDFARFYARRGGMLEGTAGFAPYYFPGATCIPGLRKIFVTVDGRFLPCERVEDQVPYVTIGNVDDGFDREHIQQIIDDYCQCIEDDCRTCWAIRMCAGPCLSPIMNEDGTGIDANRKRSTAQALSA